MKSCWALSASLGCGIQTALWRAQKQPRPISESQRSPFLPGNGGGGWEVTRLIIFAVAGLVTHSSSVFFCSDGEWGAEARHARGPRRKRGELELKYGRWGGVT